jgi:hypothetical protein
MTAGYSSEQATNTCQAPHASSPAKIAPPMSPVSSIAAAPPPAMNSTIIAVTPPNHRITAMPSMLAQEA